MSVTIRRATAGDVGFLTDAIIESEKSGSDSISYCRIFGISEAELRHVLRAIFYEDIADQEICIGNFLVAEANGAGVAAVSGWVEGAGGISGSLARSNLFMYMLGTDRFLKAAPAISMLQGINIPRGHGALQLESVYVVPQYRGAGLVGQLFDQHIHEALRADSSLAKAQTIVLKRNIAAVTSYVKIGFAIVAENTCADGAILQLLPGGTKLLLEKNISLR